MVTFTRFGNGRAFSVAEIGAILDSRILASEAATRRWPRSTIADDCFDIAGWSGRIDHGTIAA
jgi:hypothetical protein